MIEQIEKKQKPKKTQHNQPTRVRIRSDGGATVAMTRSTAETNSGADPKRPKP